MQYNHLQAVDVNFDDITNLITFSNRHPVLKNHNKASRSIYILLLLCSSV